MVCTCVCMGRRVDIQAYGNALVHISTAKRARQTCLAAGKVHGRGRRYRREAQHGAKRCCQSSLAPKLQTPAANIKFWIYESGFRQYCSTGDNNRSQKTEPRPRRGMQVLAYKSHMQDPNNMFTSRLV